MEVRPTVYFFEFIGNVPWSNSLFKKYSLKIVKHRSMNVPSDPVDIALVPSAAGIPGSRHGHR